MLISFRESRCSGQLLKELEHYHGHTTFGMLMILNCFTQWGGGHDLIGSCKENNQFVLQNLLAVQ